MQESVEEGVQPGAPLIHELVEGVKFAYTVPSEQHSDIKQVCICSYVW